MKITMAEGDYFSIGSLVTCSTCHGQKISGEVVAFDHGTKMLALKSPSTTGKPNTHDVRLVNLTMVSHVDVDREETSTPPPLASLQIQKLQQRFNSNKEEKQKQAAYVGTNVPPEGQQLVNFISRTIADVRWEEDTIVVMDAVRITRPYGPENCKGADKALIHVTKLVEKHHRESKSNNSTEQISHQRAASSSSQ